MVKLKEPCFLADWSPFVLLELYNKLVWLNYGYCIVTTFFLFLWFYKYQSYYSNENLQKSKLKM